MIFSTDEQTKIDLGMTETASNRSIASLFKPVTIGGQALLMQMLNNPVADIGIIQNRIATISYLHQNNIKINLNKEEVDFSEHYLNQGKGPVKASPIRAFKNSFVNRLSASNHYYIITRGVSLLIKLINDIASIHSKLIAEHRPTLLNDIDKIIEAIKNKNNDVDFRTASDQQKLNSYHLEKCDNLFRYRAYQEVKTLLNAIYELDVYAAAAQTACKLKFTYPQFINVPGPLLELEALFHPLVENAISNDITFNETNNLCYITGANMAGKSTLLKSVWIAVLLAHVGFPVPASTMRLSLFKGLFTTVNLSDNINAGHSHFYAEVLRVKEMALNIRNLGSVVVIFDELFRGTNVKDAYDASLAVIKALAQIKSCLFIVSTHITEVAEQLQNNENIFF